MMKLLRHLHRYNFATEHVPAILAQQVPIEGNKSHELVVCTSAETALVLLLSLKVNITIAYEYRI